MVRRPEQALGARGKWTLSASPNTCRHRPSQALHVPRGDVIHHSVWLLYIPPGLSWLRPEPLSQDHSPLPPPGCSPSPACSSFLVSRSASVSTLGPSRERIRYSSRTETMRTFSSTPSATREPMATDPPISNSAKFKILTPASPCGGGEAACVNDKLAQCVNGRFVLTSCSAGMV